jgi:hypothetical protein
MSWMLLCRAQALLARGDYEGARDAATRSLLLPADINTPRTAAHLLRAASLAHLGLLDEARSALDEARRLRPALRRELVSVHSRGASRDYQERYLEGLRLAGLRE